MQSGLRDVWKHLIPDVTPISSSEQARSALGAALGILVTGVISAFLLGYFLPEQAASLPVLIAPMGASAVLLFAVPTSPLAQPWSILGGNLCAALIGVTVAQWVPDLLLASALAIGGAIAAMIALRCLHPPSGAIALTAVLGGPGIHALGYGFVLWPVACNSLLLLASALLYNRLAGRRYPHRAKPALPQTPGIADTAGFQRRDLDDVLKDYDAFLDIDRDDLEDILRRTELRAYRRRSSHTTCGAVMIAGVAALSPDTTLSEALHRLRQSRVKALPVTAEDATILGIVTQTDLMDKASWSRGRPMIGLGRRLALALQGASAPNGTVKDIMTTPVRTVTPDAPLSEAIVTFAEAALHHLPVINAQAKLIGMIAQTDVLMAMVQASNQKAR
ncbi:membrane protein [Agrobacterium vitis]|nr:HPP family protein [Agrobacterium vitis]BCH63768.1 membrane protein [Agrobacterium vitis]